MEREKIDLLYLPSPESLYYVCAYQAEWYQAQGPKEWPALGGVAIHVDHDRFIIESMFYLPERAGMAWLINAIMFTESDARLLSDMPNELIVIE